MYETDFVFWKTTCVCEVDGAGSRVPRCELETISQIPMETDFIVS